MRKSIKTLLSLKNYFFTLVVGIGTFILLVAWTRELTIPMGGDTLAITAILFAFLIGFGAGAEYFGRLADKSNSLWKQCALLTLFGAISATVTSIFFLPGIFGTIAWSQKSIIFIYLWRFSLTSLLIFIPTFFFGGLLPTIIKIQTKFKNYINIEIGYIYALYSLGGLIGTILSGAILIPYFGSVGTISFAVMLFALLYFSIWLFKTSYLESEIEKKLLPENKNHNPWYTQIQTTSLERKLLLFAIALLGSIAISLEIIWTRTLGLMTGSTILGFSIMVSTCLVGISIGSYLMTKIAKNLEKPLYWFSTFVVLAGVTAVGSSWFINELPWWFNRIGSIAGVIPGLELPLKFILSSLVLFPPMALIGGLIPLSSMVIIYSPNYSGRKIGRLFSMYMTGSGIGGLITAIILVPTLGLKSTVALVTSILIVLGALLLFVQMITQKKLLYLSQGVIASLFALINFLAPPPWNPLLFSIENIETSNKRDRTHFNNNLISNESSWLVYEDGLNASVGIIENREKNTKFLTINGRRILSTPIEIGPSESNIITQKLMGIMPIALTAAEISRALVIGAGTGITISTLLKDKAIKQVDVIEIETALYKLDRYFKNDEQLSPIKNERVDSYAGDTRDFLFSNFDRYNLITTSTPSPSYSGGANTFTTEFYGAISRRLTGDGIFCQWIETGKFNGNELKAIVRTFRENFAVTMVAEGGSPRDIILIGSKTPIHLNIDAIKKRLAFFMENNKKEFTYATLLSHLLLGPNGSYKFGLGAPILSDSKPWIEFSKSLITQTANSAREDSNLKLLSDFVDTEVARMVQTDFQSSKIRASMLAYVAIECLRKIKISKSYRARLESVKNFITLSFETEATPEGLYAYSLLTDIDQGDIYKSLLNYKPATPLSLVIQGEVALNYGDLLVAKNFLNLAIKADSKLARAYYLNGVTSERLNQINEAITFYKKGVEFGSSNAAISLGNLYFKNRNLEEAQKWYLNAIVLNPNSWISWDNLGKVYFEENRRDEAIKAFKFVLLIKPDYPEPFRYLGNIFSQLGKTEQSLIFYERYLSISQNRDIINEVTRELAAIKASEQ